MAETTARLLRSFAAVFPELSEAQLAEASLGSLEAWDSVATITLLSLVEEEFGVSFEPEDLGRLTSFAKILDHLETKGVS
jgi:acyl carrier protein